MEKIAPGFFRSLDQSWKVFEGNQGDYKVLISIIGGKENSTPLIGDWNLDAKDTWGIYQPDTGEVNLENIFDGNLVGMDFILPANSVLVVDDWYGTGRGTIAFLVTTDWVILPENCECSYANYPPPYRFPVDNGIPVSGIWP